MSIDNSTVRKVAKLSRIKILESDDEEIIKKELNKILDWVDELQKVDTSDIEPMLSVFNESMKMRKDISEKKFETKKILENAPEKKSGFFVVPKVVE